MGSNTTCATAAEPPLGRAVKVALRPERLFALVAPLLRSEPSAEDARLTCPGMAERQEDLLPASGARRGTSARCVVEFLGTGRARK